MMLHPHALWRCRALHEAMHVLRNGVVGELRRRVLSAHAFPTLAPGHAAILRVPDSAGRDCDEQAPGTARIDADRVDARQISASAHPLPALGMVPERAHHLPALAVIFG